MTIPRCPSTETSNERSEEEPGSIERTIKTRTCAAQALPGQIASLAEISATHNSGRLRQPRAQV